MRNVAIVGLGYVGSALAEAILDGTDMLVHGIDPNVGVLENARGLFINSESKDRFTSSATKEETPKLFDVVVLCVPTPLRQDGTPDYSLISSALVSLETIVDEGGLVVLESTVAPGTTRELVWQYFKDHSRFDIEIAFSPERVDPGNPNFGLKNTPKVVAGLDATARQRATDFYSNFVDEVVPASSLEAAEASKLIENTFRLLNISWVNELASILEPTSLSIHELLRLADTKPFGFMKFTPGVGAGGHCIPVDPVFFQAFLASKNRPSQLIKTALDINSSRPVDLVKNILEKTKLKSPKMLVLGLTYKPESPDLRESKSVRIVKELSDSGVDVYCYDSYVSDVDRKSLGFRFVSDSEIKTTTWDSALLCIGHKHVLNMAKYVNCPNKFTVVTDDSVRNWSLL